MFWMFLLCLNRQLRSLLIRDRYFAVPWTCASAFDRCGKCRFASFLLRYATFRADNVYLCPYRMKWSNILVELEVIASNTSGVTALADYCCDKNFACILTCVSFKLAEKNHKYNCSFHISQHVRIFGRTFIIFEIIYNKNVFFKFNLIV